MRNDKEMPQLLIIDRYDGDLKNGIKLGYYPKFIEPIQNGTLNIISAKEAKKYNLMSPPKGEGKDFYVGNPSADNFLPMLESEGNQLNAEMMRTLVVDKSFAVKEALVWMGAKDITLKSDAEDKDNIIIGLKNKLGLKRFGLGLGTDVDYSSSTFMSIKSNIESHDSNRRPESVEKIKEFMIKHGLDKDTSLVMLLERLKQQGKLSGVEKYVVKFYNEIESALNIAVSIDYKLFNDTLNFSRLHKHTKSINKEIEINFG